MFSASRRFVTSNVKTTVLVNAVQQYCTDFMWKYLSGPRYFDSTNSHKGSFYEDGLTYMFAWICNYIHYKVWDEIVYPFVKFNGASIVWKWMNYLISHLLSVSLFIIYIYIYIMPLLCFKFSDVQSNTDVDMHYVPPIFWKVINGNIRFSGD